MAEIALQSPADAFALSLFAAQDAEQNVVHHIRDDDGGAKQKDGEEPAVTKMDICNHLGLRRADASLDGRQAKPFCVEVRCNEGCGIPARRELRREDYCSR